MAGKKKGFNFVEQKLKTGTGQNLNIKVMELLYVYDIHLEDGRKGLNWIEDDTKEELWSYFELSENSWKEILLEIEQEFGSKVIKYKYKFEDYDEDDDFQDDEE